MDRGAGCTLVLVGLPRVLGTRTSADAVAAPRRVRHISVPEVHHGQSQHHDHGPQQSDDPGARPPRPSPSPQQRQLQQRQQVAGEQQRRRRQRPGQGPGR